MTKVEEKQKDIDTKYSHIPKKGSWEIPRKTFHYSIGKFVIVGSFAHGGPNGEQMVGFVVLYLYMNGVETSDVYPVLIVFLSIVGSAELLRFNFEWFNQLYCFLLGPLMRPTEVKSRINGVVYYLLGMFYI